MRISAALITAISVPVLLLTACTVKNDEPLRGIVIDKEHEEAVYGTRQVPVTKKKCTTTRRNGRTTTSCTTVNTGKTKKDRYLKKHECYELDIRVSDGEVVEVCNEDAYFALNIEDRYSSAKDYSEVNR